MESVPLPVICKRDVIAVFDDGTRQRLSFSISGPLMSPPNHVWRVVVARNGFYGPGGTITQFAEEFFGNDSLGGMLDAAAFLNEMCKPATEPRPGVRYYYANEKEDALTPLHEYVHFGTWREPVRYPDDPKSVE